MVPRASKLSKSRNAVCHPDIGLHDAIAKALEVPRPMECPAFAELAPWTPSGVVVDEGYGSADTADLAWMFLDMVSLQSSVWRPMPLLLSASVGDPIGT